MPDPHEALHEALGDRYEIQKVLGEGDIGTVYLAQELRHDRPVAIKTIHPHLELATTVRDRFEREIQITAHLQHPRILSLLDSSVAGTLYYVMPHVEGESLKERLEKERQLPEEPRSLR